MTLYHLIRLQVESRTGPGSNKPGGIARVTKVRDGTSELLFLWHVTSLDRDPSGTHHADGACDVRYILDGRVETKVSPSFLKAPATLTTQRSDRTARRRISMPALQ
jgi:hypothetical protein